MQIVAITRWGAPLESELAVLATMLKAVAYDLRLRIAGVLPAVLTTFPDAESAMQLTAALRARGHGVVVCDSVELTRPHARLIARDFELGSSSLMLKDETGKPSEIPYADFSCLIRSSQISTAEHNVTTVEKKLNVGMAVMSGGLIMSKKVERTQHSAVEVREQVLYLFRRGKPAPVVFRESVVRYQGLAAQLKPTTMQNFVTLVECLRAKAPSALYDQRFLTHKRKLAATVMSGLSNDRRVESTNASENDLGAHLLWLAHEQDQLQ